MCRWTYETSDSDFWRGGIFDTKEEAIREGNQEAKEEGRDTFKVGIVEEVSNFGIDIDQVLENIGNSMYDEVGEVAEDYLYDVTKEHREELEESLNKVFYAWQEKYNYKPTFYKVVSEEIIKVL